MNDVPEFPRTRAFPAIRSRDDLAAAVQAEIEGRAECLSYLTDALQNVQQNAAQYNLLAGSGRVPVDYEFLGMLNGLAGDIGLLVPRIKAEQAAIGGEDWRPRPLSEDEDRAFTDAAGRRIGLSLAPAAAFKAAG